MADTAVGLEFEAALALGRAGSEERLLVGLRRGDESAFEVLIQDYELPIFNLVSRLVDDSADAADVVQEVFIKVFRKVTSFRGESSLRTWIYRIAVNEARNHRRWFARHKRREVTLEPLPGETRGYSDWLEDAARSPFELALDRETEKLVEDALRKVSPAFRAALVLREIEGLSYEEVAEILQISLGTVKSKILRGREALRKSLAAELDRASAVGTACGRPAKVASEGI
ncbi:MAG TPA: sigma-70 family RNA polymerase sigma factor [Bryobacteraceae bacterium]|nr:sigma-70 family RNA polymerase sigma factor [Bryobacteraceae bacterium]